jgi:hypothetical protein
VVGVPSERAAMVSCFLKTLDPGLNSITSAIIVNVNFKNTPFGVQLLCIFILRKLFWCAEAYRSCDPVESNGNTFPDPQGGTCELPWNHCLV